MHSFRDSWTIFSKLSGAQKLVPLRIFIVINIAAYFLATQHDFDSDWVYVGTLVVVYALESAFMLWLGFKRGIGFHRAAVGSIGITMPLAQKRAGSAWYAMAVGFSVVLTVAMGLVVTSIDDGSSLAPLRVFAFLFVEAIVTGFALLQGLRLGWNAVALNSDSVTPTGIRGSDVRRDALAPSDVSLPSTEDHARSKKRAETIKRGQVALGGISLICAGLAIYLHLVAHEMAKPDPSNDAATQTIAQALGNATASPADASPTEQQDALPPDDPRVSDVMVKASQVASKTDTAQELDTFPFPVAAGIRSPDGYPIYLLECNVEANTCFGGEGQAYGTLVKTADQLTPIRNSDAMRYTCIQRICVDLASNYVGAISSTMQTYWDAHHRPVQGFPR